jgi:hypothetical protein
MKFSASKTALAFGVLLCILTVRMYGQTNSDSRWFWLADAEERGRGLPPGVPRTVDTNGNVEYIDHHFTTRAYQNEACRLMIMEANQAAKALHLAEDLPITRSKIGASVTPFDFFYRGGLMGFIATTNYAYRVLNGGKLDHIELDHSYEVWRDLQDSLLPEDQVDNRAAYQLATQWLTALSVDVQALNRDCQMTVASSPVLNYVGSGKEPARRMFAPTYDVTWKSSNGPAAFVQLFLPDKLLIQLSIDDPKYNLRPPLVFTNLTALFPGTALIRTNYPVTPTVVEMGQFFSPEVTFITDSNQPEPGFHDVPLNRWIQTQTQLNPSHLSLSELMTLKPVAGPDEWGVVTFDLPVRFDALHFHSDPPMPGGTVDLGSIDPDGNFVECTLCDCNPSPAGNTRLSWNINWNSPGLHELRARMTYCHGMDGDQFNLIGPALSYYSSNTCRFYESSTLFNSDGANLYAKLREPAAKFRVEVTSLQGRLVNDFSGSTTNGEINLAWDLTGMDGKKYTNNSFIGSFYVTYPDDTRTNPPVKARFNKIGTSGD